MTTFMLLKHEITFHFICKSRITIAHDVLPYWTEQMPSTGYL